MKRGSLQFALSLVVLLLLFGFCVFSFSEGHRRFSSRWEEENVMYFPSGKFLEPVVLGYNAMAADFLWVRTVNYFGVHSMSDRKYPYLAPLLDAITILDPTWDFPYHFAGVVLPSEVDVIDEANRIVRRGMDNLPDVWQFPFYIGFNYFHFKNNSRCGAKYIYKAASHEKAPAYLVALAAKLSSQGNTPENHRAMCLSLLETTRVDNMRKRILEYCNKLPAGTSVAAEQEDCL